MTPSSSGFVRDDPVAGGPAETEQRGRNGSLALQKLLLIGGMGVVIPMGSDG